MLFKTLANSALALIYPQECQVCGNSVESKSDGLICAKCWENTGIFSGDETFCYKCGKMAVGDLPKGEHETVRCHQCDGDFFDFARAVGNYDNALKSSILHLKHTPFIAERLQKLFYQAFLQNPAINKATRIVPVPLSDKRQKERGFNQAQILGEILAKFTGLPCDELAILRKIHTEKHRACMDKKARQESVRNAFEAKHPRLLKDEKILLVDDVFTTGATVSNCAKALKKQGASEVFVLTIAHAK